MTCPVWAFKISMISIHYKLAKKIFTSSDTLHDSSKRILHLTLHPADLCDSSNWLLWTTQHDSTHPICAGHPCRTCDWTRWWGACPEAVHPPGPAERPGCGLTRSSYTLGRRRWHDQRKTIKENRIQSQCERGEEEVGLTGPQVAVRPHHAHHKRAGYPPAQAGALWERPRHLQGHEERSAARRLTHYTWNTTSSFIQHAGS